MQGLWLIHSGYSIDLGGSDPSSLGRNAARGRGGGGLVILIIIFFPYLLIGGFGFLAYKTFTFANDELPKKLKRLEDHEKEIQSMSIEKRQQWTEEMRMREEEEIRAKEKRKGVTIAMSSRFIAFGMGGLGGLTWIRDIATRSARV